VQNLATPLPVQASKNMLRIEEVHEDPAGATLTLRVAGQLTGPWVEELVNALHQHDANSAVVLDLRDVSFADAAGVQLLRSLQTQHRISLRCSAVVAAQLAR
jgi:anti-anti-sigma regulatory factor